MFPGVAVAPAVARPGDRDRGRNTDAVPGVAVAPALACPQSDRRPSRRLAVQLQSRFRIAVDRSPRHSGYRPTVWLAPASNPSLRGRNVSTRVKGRIRVLMYRIASGAGRLACGAAAVAGTLVFFACTAAWVPRRRPRPRQRRQPTLAAHRLPRTPAPAPAAPAPRPAGTLTLTTPCGNALGMPPARAAAARQRPVPVDSRAVLRQAGRHLRGDSNRNLHVLRRDPAQRDVAGVFVSMDEAAEQTMRADFKALWATNFLEDLSIELTRVHLPERHRRRDRDLPHGGARAGRDRQLRGPQADRPQQIDEKLRERAIEVRLVRSWTMRSSGVKTVLRQMMAEKGFTNAEVDHKVVPVAGRPKLVNITFNVSEGRRSRSRRSTSSATRPSATAR